MSDKKVEVADEIKHLSFSEIEELYQKYLRGEKSSVLIEEYNISIKPNNLIKLLPPKKLEDTFCPYCGIPMFTKRMSKSARSWDVPPIECYKCNHMVFSEKLGNLRQLCECDECASIRRRQTLEEEREKRQKIRNIYNIESISPVDYAELTFFHKLLLLALFRMQTDENFGYILSLDDPSRTELLSPTKQMDLECVKDLFSCEIIIVDPESRIDAFDKNEGFIPFYNQTRWIPNITFDGVSRAKLNLVYNEIYQEIKGGIQPQWEMEIFNTLFRIAREEVLQYVQVRAHELNVYFSAVNKTREITNQLLQQFSVSEIYYFVTKSVENAHIYYSKGYAKNKKHAANTIPNKILSFGERAIDEAWNTYKSSRDSRAPRSFISKIFYDLLLQDEDSGFHKAPGKHWERELYPRYFCEDKSSKGNGLYCVKCNSKNISVKRLEGNLEISCDDCATIEKFTPIS